MAGAALAGQSGNPSDAGTSFNAVLNQNGGGIVSTFRAGDVEARGVGGLVSELALGSGGQFVAIAAGGNPQFVPSVPEPDAALMLLVGLGMVGVVARRRLRR